MIATVQSAGSQVARRTALLFLGGLTFTAAWLGVNVWVPGLQATGVPSVVIRVIVHTAMLTGLWLALTRTSFDRRARVTVWLAIALPFSAWLGVVWWLAIDGAFLADSGSRLPVLPIAIFLPLLITLPILLRSRRVAELLDAMPASWPVAIQAYRVFGGIFLVGWLRGETSGTFALPAGSGDVLVGLLALPTAYVLQAGVAGGRKVAIGWNVLGLIDFAIAVGVGILSAPGPLQLIIPDAPNAQVGTFPTVMIPAFAVPSSIVLHILSLWQLTRQGRRSNDRPAPAARSTIADRQSGRSAR